MTDSHPSRLDLERHSVDDLPEPATARLDGHIAECAACRAYLGELREAASVHRATSPARFVAGVLARDLAERRARKRRLVIAGAVMVAAAAVIVVVMRPASRAPDDPEIVAFKGAGITIHRKRGEVVGPMGESDRVRAADVLRIVVTLERPSRVAAWIVDDTGRVDDLTSTRVELPAGQNPLPGAVEVEAPCVDSVVVVATGDAAELWTTADVRAHPALRPRAAGSAPPGIRAVAVSCE